MIRSFIKPFSIFLFFFFHPVFAEDVALSTSPFSKEQIAKYYEYLNVLYRSFNSGDWADDPHVMESLQAVGLDEENDHIAMAMHLFTYDTFNNFDEGSVNPNVKAFCVNDNFWKKLEISDYRLYYRLTVQCSFHNTDILDPEKINKYRAFQRESLQLKNNWVYVDVTSELAALHTKRGNHIAALIEWEKIIDDIRPLSSAPILNEVDLEIALDWMSDSYLALQAYSEVVSLSEQLIALIDANPNSQTSLRPYINLISAYDRQGKSELAKLAVLNSLTVAKDFINKFDGNFQKTSLLVEALQVDSFRESLENNSEFKNLLDELNALDYASKTIYDAPRSQFLLNAVNSFYYARNGDFERAKNVLPTEDSHPDYIPSHQLVSFYKIAALSMAELGNFESAFNYQVKAEIEHHRGNNNAGAFIPDIIDSQNTRIEAFTVELLQAQLENQAIKLESNQLRVMLISLIAIILSSALIFFVYRYRKALIFANTDSLTKALTRRAIMPMIASALSDKRRKSTIAIIDLDHFKRINDSYGHVMGDEVLIEFAKHVSSRTRKTDKFARYGGEEFLILFDTATHGEAKQLLDSIRDSFSNITSWNSTTEEVSISFSCGVVEVENKHSAAEAIKCADELLYEAKRNGRARTSSAAI